jgi:hypothetical protein
MNPENLKPSTVGFALSAAVTILFNTALAWAKDAYAPLNGWLKSIAGHHWTTHGLIDLVLFVALGLIFTNSRIARSFNSAHVAFLLAASVLVGSLGLGIWYLFY